jgi:hypothetical protein
MSDFDPERFEKELITLRPAKAPEGLIRRMAEAAPSSRQQRLSPGILQRLGGWPPWLRWGSAAAVAVAILVAMVSQKLVRTPQNDRIRAALSPIEPSLKADKIEISQELLTSFEAVTQLPDGEPVRLRCRQWLDGVTLRDTARGVVIERQAPRLEVVPVRFEIY